MSLPVVVRPEAEADLLAALDRYEQQRAGLGDSFRAAAETMLARIEAMPELYAAEFRGVRRAKLRRFPFVVYYRMLADRSEVIAVLHGARDPQIWRDRA